MSSFASTAVDWITRGISRPKWYSQNEAESFRLEAESARWSLEIAHREIACVYAENTRLKIELEAADEYIDSTRVTIQPKAA